jgi:choline transport protein
MSDQTSNREALTIPAGEKDATSSAIAFGGEEMQSKKVIEQPFSLLSLLGIAYSITNTAISLIIGLASGAFMGGGPLYVWGTLLMGLVGFCVAISLGELASAMPHSGGQYFWVAQLAPPRIRRPLSYLTGIFSWGGAVFTGASGSITIPLMILGMTSLRNPDFEYKTWMGFVGFQITTWGIFCLNLFERLLPYLGKVALVLPVITFIIMFISILAVSEKQSAELVFIKIRNESGWNDGIAWMIGISAIHWCFSCLDSCTHMADEIPNPAKNIPKVLLWTVGLGILTGFPFAIAIWYAVNDVDALVASFVPPSLQVFYQALGGNTNGALGIESLLVLCNIVGVASIHTWQSRLAWAFSRDHGFPFSRHLGRVVQPPFRTPLWAHLWSCVWTSILGCLYMGSPLAFNSFVSGGIVLQNITYSTSIILLLYHGRSNFAHGSFWFPRLGLFANIVVVIWSTVSMIFYCFPYYLPVTAVGMNYLAPVLVVMLLYAGGYWVLYGKKNYQLPPMIAHNLGTTL